MLGYEFVNLANFRKNLNFRTVSSTGHVRSLLRRASLGVWANRLRRCVHLAEFCKLGFCFVSFDRHLTIEIAPKVPNLSHGLTGFAASPYCCRLMHQAISAFVCFFLIQRWSMVNPKKHFSEASPSLFLFVAASMRSHP